MFCCVKDHVCTCYTFLVNETFAAFWIPDAFMLNLSKHATVHKDELDSIRDYEKRKRRLVELNAQEQ